MHRFRTFVNLREQPRKIEEFLIITKQPKSRMYETGCVETRKSVRSASQADAVSEREELHWLVKRQDRMLKSLGAASGI